MSFYLTHIERIVSLGIGLAVLFMVGCSDNPEGRTRPDPKQSATAPSRTVKTVMVEEIEPASNTLWAVAMDENIPKTDADWNVLQQAANQLLAAAHTIEAGGNGPNEILWSQQPEWQTNNQRMIEIGSTMLNSIHNKDYDALLESGFILIEPCGACHTAFTIEPAQ